jgi:hypothetical protein
MERRTASTAADAGVKTAVLTEAIKILPVYSGIVKGNVTKRLGWLRDVTVFTCVAFITNWLGKRGLDYSGSGYGLL